MNDIIGSEDIVFGETRHAEKHVARLQLRPGCRVRAKSGIYAGTVGRVMASGSFGLITIDVAREGEAAMPVAMLEADLEPVEGIEA